MDEKVTFLLDRKQEARQDTPEDFIHLFDNSKSKVINQVTVIEQILISRLNAADHSAYSCIFSAYYKDLVIFASRFTHDIDNAEEIIQDTFVSLWEDHESIKINTSLKSYLIKTVQNKCIDWYRHKKIVQNHNDFVIETSPLFEYDTDNYVLYSELKDKIDIVLESLPAEVSEAFRMNRYQGLKYHEIADMLNVSERTIEVRIGKALHLIRNYVKKYFFIFFATLFI